MMKNEDKVRNYYYIKITYSNGKTVRYKEFPMNTFEQGVKDHFIKDMKPLNAWEMMLIDFVDWMRGIK